MFVYDVDTAECRYTVVAYSAREAAELARNIPRIRDGKTDRQRVLAITERTTVDVMSPDAYLEYRRG